MKTVGHFLLWMLLLFACSPFKQNDRQNNQVLQLLLQEGDTLSADLVEDLLDKSESGFRLYRWKNRVLFYGKEKKVTALYNRCKTQLPKAEVTLFSNPFYVFNRKQCAEEMETRQAHDPIILSANLIADSAMQQAYLNYHHRQLAEWPEVSKGFCKAEFQQVFLFKTGRQLLLIINIPKGADFDLLNKRTVENNPRVAEWNRLMSTYQEGLPGTKAGEVWVRFGAMNDEFFCAFCYSQQATNNEQRITNNQ